VAARGVEFRRQIRKCCTIRGGTWSMHSQNERLVAHDVSAALTHRANDNAARNQRRRHNGRFRRWSADEGDATCARPARGSNGRRLSGCSLMYLATVDRDDRAVSRGGQEVENQ